MNAVIGIIIFSAALILIGVVFRIVGSVYYDKKYPRPKSKGTTQGEPLPEELAAVISAAIADSLQGGIVVRKISLLHNASDSAWSRTGRLSIMSSHTVQPKH